MRLLVTGGAGYVGSVTTAVLLAQGHEVTVLDDVSTGYVGTIPAGAAFVRGTIREHARAVLEQGVDAVLHFAAKSLVGESVAVPSRYWRHNLGGTLALLDAMRVTGTTKIIFSSTAAVYGEPERIPIDESAPPRPTNPYGASKLAVDTALEEFSHLYGIGAVSLRYFNVAGAAPGTDGVLLGERHDPETHLIPNVLAVALGRPGAREVLEIFGDDYPTADGTCIRDYIHVSDLARAHVLALAACKPGEHRVYNLGSGNGASNLEVITACREVTGRPIPTRFAARRPGDPAVLVASSDRICAELGWQRERSLHDMVADAWAFAQSTAR
jgi:UDP-glucose 4-epimerase